MKRARTICCCLVFAAGVAGGCGGEPPIAQPAAAPIAVARASANTTNLTRVVEWRFYLSAAGGPEELLVFGADADGNGVAEMHLLITLDASGQPSTVESAVMKGGAWSERWVLDYGAPSLARYSHDYAQSRLLWQAASADVQALPPGGLGTQSAGIPYAGCDGCAVEISTAIGACGGYVVAVIPLAAPRPATVRATRL